jgi:PDZ domain-containing secreted protein
MRYLSQEQRSIFLLVFILLFIILTPFLEGDPGGELILVINMYLTLVAATMELKEKRALFLSAIPIAATSMVLLFLNYFRPTRGLSIASSVILAVFLGLVSVSLFAYLGRRGRLRVAVSMCR